MNQDYIENILMQIYNEIAIKPVSNSTQNLFAPDTNPLDMVYFLDEVEEKFNYCFHNSDFVYENFNNIEKIAQIISKGVSQ